MSDQGQNTAGATAAAAGVPAKKKRAPQGPRKPSPLYAFATVTDAAGNPIADAKVVINAQFRDPRKMAEHFQGDGKAQTLLIISPES